MIRSEQNERFFRNAGLIDGSYDLTQELVRFSHGKKIRFIEPGFLMARMIHVVEVDEGEGGLVRDKILRGGGGSGEGGVGGMFVLGRIYDDVTGLGFDESGESLPVVKQRDVRIRTLIP